jgi:PST family polysaccharide transporter
LKADRIHFARTLETQLRYLALVTTLTLSLALALAPELIHFIFTDKWAPALLLFYFYAIRMIAGTYTTLLDLGIKALGYPDTSLRILSWWTLWECALALASVLLLGYKGLALSAALAIWPALYLLHQELRRHVSISLVRPSTTPIVSGAVCFLGLLLTKKALVAGPLTLLATLLAGVVLYALTATALEGPRLWTRLTADLRTIFRADGHRLESTPGRRL